jgi:hypothetical protein
MCSGERPVSCIQINRSADLPTSSTHHATVMTLGQQATQAPREELQVLVNGQSVYVPSGASVAVAIMTAGVPFRRSVSGEPRAAFCAMGVCEECRATVDGVSQVRTCQRIATHGMEIVAG